MVIIGTIVLAFGISLSVVANVIMNSGEAFVKALSDITKKDFGSLKVGFDVMCVVAAVVLSMLFFHLSIQGTREGTIIAALLTGVFVKGFMRLFGQKLSKVLVS